MSPFRDRCELHKDGRIAALIQGFCSTFSFAKTAYQGIRSSFGEHRADICRGTTPEARILDYIQAGGSFDQKFAQLIKGDLFAGRVGILLSSNLTLDPTAVETAKQDTRVQNTGGTHGSSQTLTRNVELVLQG